ncbi:putative harbinger transposase-derived nuclease [Abeliophyllum distichum]|uniref:Harbinger transposase-derived nuclease n=1 Tax=Abeliophyllum distichum TaxID=126358 RepID=A0ABD1TJ43_9LAMI
MDEELDIYCVIESDSDDGSDSSSDSSDEERLANLVRDTLTWLRYCRMAWKSSSSIHRKFTGFAHRPGYMAPYKGPDIRYHFQEFSPAGNSGCRQFRNPHERFNFNHSSLRNVIERAFGVLKNMWNILDRMPNYSFQKQTAVVVATMAIHNFLRCAGQVGRAFETVE